MNPIPGRDRQTSPNTSPSPSPSINPNANPSEIMQALGDLVPDHQLWSWQTSTALVQSQVSQAIGAHQSPACLVYPQTEAELAAIQACASAHGWRVLPMGSGSKLHWGELASGVEIVIGLDRLNRLIDHAIGDLTVTAEAGMRFADLQRILTQTGQFLAIDPFYADAATLGGIVATADTGFLRQRYQGVRDMLIGISFIRSDGELAKAGGRVVKNVAGYDLMKLLTGSWGTLGIISQLTFRIYPLPPDSRTVLLTGNAPGIASTIATLLTSGLTPTAIALISQPTLASLNLAHNLTGNLIGKMGLVVRFQSIAVSVATQAEQLVKLGQSVNLNALILQETNEQDLWTQLREQMESAYQATTLTCKMGVLPSKAVETLELLDGLMPHATTVIYAGSGLGILRSHQPISLEKLLELRSFCQAQGGFLTVLTAPTELKQTLDLWGYPGNAINLMQGIKHQFDPQNLLSPHRFIAGI